VPRLERDADVPFEALHPPVDAVQPFRQGGLAALVGIARQERGDGGLGDEGPGLRASRGKIGQERVKGIEPSFSAWKVTSRDD
jgi:hypothetical protein